MTKVLGGEKPSLEDLTHYGVKGMRWGERRRTIHQARRKAGKLADDVDDKEAAYVTAKKSGKASAISKARKDLNETSKKEDRNLLTAATLTRGEQIAISLVGGPLGLALVAGQGVATRDNKKIKDYSDRAVKRLDKRAARS